MSTASFKLKGQRLVGKWISIEYEEEGKPVWYKARVDTYGGAQKYEVTWETGGSEWLEKLVDAAAITTDSPAYTALDGGLDLMNIDNADLTSAYRLFLADSLNAGAEEYDQVGLKGYNPQAKQKDTTPVRLFVEQI